MAKKEYGRIQSTLERKILQWQKYFCTNKIQYKESGERFSNERGSSFTFSLVAFIRPFPSNPQIDVIFYNNDKSILLRSLKQTKDI